MSIMKMPEWKSVCKANRDLTCDRNNSIQSPLTILLNNSKSLLLHPNITQHNITDIYDEYFQVHKANLSSKNQTFRDLFEMDVYERLLNVNYMRSIFKLHGPIVLNGKVFKSLDNTE